MEKISSSIPETFVHIVGNNMLQNKLLLSFLKKETGFQSTCAPNVKATAPTHKSESALPQFFLVDCDGIDIENLLEEINSWKSTNQCQCFFALCNIEPETQIEKKVAAHTIQGIFYNNNPLPMIIKGIFAILRGDLWYSKKILTKSLQPKFPFSSSEDTANKDLTSREQETITLLASGCRYKEIADKLCISLNTVKTHSYNIYKKINVSNRLQASLWAAKYLKNS